MIQKKNFEMYFEKDFEMYFEKGIVKAFKNDKMQ